MQNNQVEVLNEQSTNGVANINNQPNTNNVVSAPVQNGVNLGTNIGLDKKGRAQRPIKGYRYVIINGVGKKEKGTFDAESADDVRSFLTSLDYQVLEVKERNKLDVDIGGGKFTAADLSFSLTQLSTYLKAGIPLADSVRILAKQSKKAATKKSFFELVYQLLKGESLSEAMELQDKVYPKLLINMVKTAEMTGDLPSILDDMAEYYTSMDQTRKQMKSAMTYPLVVLFIAIGVLIFMLTYLVPQFSAMFEANGAKLPALTLAVMAVSNFIKAHWIIILLVLAVVIFGLYELYIHVQKFRQTVQLVLMHLPVFKDIIIYNEVANFTKTFASLLNHGVFITDSMEILSKITNNEIYKRIINNTLENLGRGDSISSAFKGEWAIPVVAYEMIVTGETTGQLGQMMEKVAAHFQMLHKNIIEQMKSLIEPILICLLAVVVGVILLSIIQPMFSIYNQIK
ncbi:MAG: type II secretion system F family protein [Bacilli bacterium]|nr:type II secretion system F family protein [Bacilli bacterium]